MEVEAILSTDDVRQWLVERVAKMLVIPYNDIDCDAHLTEVGLDSQDALSLVTALEDLVGCRIPTSVIEDLGSINKLAHVVSALDG